MIIPFLLIIKFTQAELNANLGAQQSHDYYSTGGHMGNHGTFRTRENYNSGGNIGKDGEGYAGGQTGEKGKGHGGDGWGGDRGRKYDIQYGASSNGKFWGKQPHNDGHAGDHTGGYNGSHEYGQMSRYIGGHSDGYEFSGGHSPYHSFSSNAKNHRNYSINKDNFLNRSQFGLGWADAKLQRREAYNKLLHLPHHDMNLRARPTLGIENVIFTHLSDEVEIVTYKKMLQKSKLFKFVANYDFIVYVNLVSISRHYHPQIHFSETIDEKTFNHVLGRNDYGNYSTQYAILKDRTYVVEIGTKDGIHTGPFKDVKNGGFIALLSSKIEAIPMILESEIHQISVGGDSGKVVYIYDNDLILSSTNYGRLNYEITPYFNLFEKSITLFYIDGSNRGKGRKNRSSSIEFKAINSSDCRTYGVGMEVTDARYHFIVESRNLPELVTVFEKLDM